MATREKGKDERPLAEAERELRHDAETDREFTTAERARKVDAGQPIEQPEGKDPPAPLGEDDRGRPLGRSAKERDEPSGE